MKKLSSGKLSPRQFFSKTGPLLALLLFSLPMNAFSVPTSPSITINGGAASLTTRSATLTLSASDDVGVTGYYVSESQVTPNVADFVPITSTTSYSADVPFTLSKTYSETKTVYAWFLNEEGMTLPVSDTIDLLDNSGGPTGVEFQVNTYTTAHQDHPAVAMDSNGDFVVVWTGCDDQDGDTLGVFNRRYDASGDPHGTDFQVNFYTTDYQENPSVSMDSDGDFVVAWQSSGQDGDLNGVFARRFNSFGVPQGTDLPVNTYVTGDQMNPSVSMHSDGDFVVVWNGAGSGDTNGVFARRFDSSWNEMGSEFPVNTYTTGNQRDPSVSMDSGGDFVAVWQSSDQDGSSWSVFGQRFDSSGTARGSEFPVNTYTTGDQKNPSVSMDSGGDFVVAWQSDGQDGNLNGVFGQRFDSSGTEMGSEFPVNTYATGNQMNPSVSMDSGGDFVVVWKSSGGQDGNLDGVFGQRYDSSGTEMGSEFRVNTYTTGYQRNPSVSMDSGGDFVVAWQDGVALDKQIGQDGSDASVFTQRFDFTAPSTAYVSGPGSTGSRSVFLTLDSTDTAGVTGYYLSESSATPDPKDDDFNPLSSGTGYSFIVSAGNGLKTVYAWFKDAVGNMTSSLLSFTLSESTGGGATGPSTPSAPSTGGGAPDTGGDEPDEDPAEYIEIKGGGKVVKNIPKSGTPGGTNGAPDPDTGAAYKKKAKGKRDIKVCGVDTNGKILQDAIIYVNGKPAGTGCVVLDGNLSGEKAYRVNFGYVDGHLFVCKACGGKSTKSGLRGRADGTKMLIKEELAAGEGDDIIVEGSDSVIRITSSQKKILNVNGIYKKVTASEKSLGTVEINPVNASGQSIDDVPVYLDGAFLATGPVSPKVSSGRHKLEFGYVEGLKAKGMNKSGTTFKVKRGKTTPMSKKFQAVKRDTKAPKTRALLKKSKVTLKCKDRGKNSSGCDFTYYTTNGKKPTTKSSIYAVPVTIKKRTKLLRYFSVDKAGNAEKPKKKRFSAKK